MTNRSILIASALAGATLGLLSLAAAIKNVNRSIQLAVAHVALQTASPAPSAQPANPLLSSATSSPVRAIYLTAGTAKNPKKLASLINLVKSTSLNAMVINFKDDGPQLDQHLIDAVNQLRQNGIIPIARIVVFKDYTFAHKNPGEALMYQGDGFWLDNKGGSWLDPASRASWAYLVNTARQAADIGFEEINLDYVRFPTDGAVSSIRYPVWDGKTSKTEIISAFFKYFNEELRKTHPEIKTSLDIFGYTFITSSGLNIGQRLEDAIKYFDFIAPMVYPSHYSKGNFGYENPAAHPYDVVKKTLDSGFKKLPADLPHARIRPWLQAFDMGAEYNAYMLSEEIRALEDSGITEFYLWNPSNVYDRYASALK
jgi:hypothetical protein